MKDQGAKVWATAELATVSEVFADGNWIETKDQSSDGIRLVQTGNVGEGVFKDRRDKARWIENKTFDRLNCFEVLPGDCLVSRLPDPVGRACIIPDTGDKMITAVDCTVIRPDDAKIDRRFFVYYSQSWQYLRDVDASCTGTTRRRISRKNLGKVKIPLPPLEEQRKIVAILDEAFEGLDRARENAEVNLQNARELLANLINTIMDAAGADNLRPLGELCRFENGDRGKNYPGRKAFVPEGVPFINAGHLLNGPIDWSNMNYIPEEHYHRLSNGKVKRGDLLFCLRGSLGKFGVVDTDKAGAIASSLVIVRPFEKLLGAYLSAYFESKACVDMIDEYAGGAAQPNLSAKSLAAFKIALPSLEEQDRVVRSIAETRKLVDLLILDYRTKLQDLDQLRQSILQKAFTGELT